MPIARYFDADLDGKALDSTQAFSLSLDQYAPSGLDVPFQLPQFMFNGPPAIAPGGGAEVIPNHTFATLAAAPMNNHWFDNTDLPTPKFIPNRADKPEQSFFQPALSFLELTTGSFTPALNLTPPAHLTQPSATSASLALSKPTIPAQKLDPLPAQSVYQPLLYTPSTLGLPVYSASGFDIISILSRVTGRRNPKITLGPVDLTCSFVLVDVRRFDSPIVYCSPSFCKLTGYNEREILGRNCRFLQSPDGSVQRGAHRQWTAAEAVMLLRKCLSADKECQTSLLNYKKGGQAFLNLITVIPITGGVTDSEEEKDEIVYHVGFQVDLKEQPNVILQKLKDGTYIPNQRLGTEGGATSPYLIGGPSKDRRDRLRRIPGAMSQGLRSLLSDPAYLQSIPISSSTTANHSSVEKDGQEANNLFNLLLLESCPDFVHVLSLKGTFLYVAPSVRGVLGYESEWLVGKTVADICHPADVVPLMRELKESSTTNSSPHESAMLGHPPKTVDLLYRARDCSGTFVWVEARGRLFVEPGKGRKAIILSGRARRMSHLEWGTVAKGGGLDAGNEFWVTLCARGTLLAVSSDVREILGWQPNELLGNWITAVVGPDDATSLENAVHTIACDANGAEPRKLWVKMKHKDGNHVGVVVLLYRAMDGGHGPGVVIGQVKLSHRSHIYEPPQLGQLMHLPSVNVFEELETSRDSSWQYELQQLKFSSQRLRDEIAVLERGVASQWTALLNGSVQHHDSAQMQPSSTLREWDSAGPSGSPQGYPPSSIGHKRSWVDSNTG